MNETSFMALAKYQYLSVSLFPIIVYVLSITDQINIYLIQKLSLDRNFSS